MQDAAYGSLLKSRRQLLHARIAAALEERSRETVEQHPEVLAHHFGEAGQIDRAVEYWRRACQVAMNRSATTEAIAHSQSGLAVLMKLSEGAERDRQELAIRLAMGSALVAAHGFAAEPTGKAYERSRELCEALGDTAQLYPVIYGLILFNMYGGQLDRAREHAARLMEMAETSNDRGSAFFARRAAGVADLPSGRFVSARTHLERALDLYDEEQHRTPMFIYAFDPKVVCLDYLARALFPMGYVVQALERSDEATEVARRTGHRNSLALPLFFGGILQQLCGRADDVAWRAEELLKLALDERFKLWAAGARILRGWVDDRRSSDGAGEALVRRGVEEWTATGAVFMVPYFRTLLAEMRIGAGAADEALPILDDALARIERSGERWFEAEVHRMKGRALAALGEAEGAATCRTRAADVASAQGAVLWHLRAVIDLAGSGRPHDHHDALAAALAAIPETARIPEILLAECAVAKRG
jgi:predicted ATPase